MNTTRHSTSSHLFILFFTSYVLLLDGPQNKPSYVLFVLRLPLLLQTSHLKTNLVTYCLFFSLTSANLRPNPFTYCSVFRYILALRTLSIPPRDRDITFVPSVFHGLHGRWTRTTRYDRKRLIIGTLKIKPSSILIRAGMSP